MRLIESPELDAFRQEVRVWLHDHRPRDPRPHEGQALRDFDTAWQRTQYDGGWAGIAWPVPYGGRGLSILQQLIWWEEYAGAGCPTPGSMFVALSHAGPTLVLKGDEAQKQKHLPMILRGEAVWCQGFSEPGAGSDLANLQTRAEIDGADLVVSGSKLWTSYGPVADWQELLVRTDPEGVRHRGISWVICDMRSPGITIRPIKAMSGLTHFCQVFYDEVRIPLSNVVGELHQGWSVAMATLGFERGTGTVSHQIELARTVERLAEMVRGSRRGAERDQLAGEVAMLRAEVAALRAMTAMSISRGLSQDVPGPEGNLVALYYGEMVRRVHETALRILGARGLALEDGAQNWPLEYLEAFKWAIGGGTSEIRRNAIGERLLGLPKGR